MIRKSRFLVIGGAGTIGQAVTRETFKRDPIVLIGDEYYPSKKLEKLGFKA
jgi:hypothetical protein